LVISVARVAARTRFPSTSPPRGDPPRITGRAASHSSTRNPCWCEGDFATGNGFLTTAPSIREKTPKTCAPSYSPNALIPLELTDQHRGLPPYDYRSTRFPLRRTGCKSFRPSHCTLLHARGRGTGTIVN